MKRIKSLFGRFSRRQRIALGVMLLAVLGVVVILLSVIGQADEAVPQWTPEERRQILLSAIYTLQNEEDVQKALDIFFIIGEEKEEELTLLEADPKDVDPQALASFRQVWEEYQRQEEATQTAGTLFVACLGVVGLSLGGVGFYLLRKLGVFRALASRVKGLPRQPIQPSPQVVAVQARPELKPTATFESTFGYPNELYEDIFAIRDTSLESLGETGIEIADVLRKDSRFKMPVAFLVWLFDKADIASSSLVVLSPWAYNQKGIRDELEKKGGVVMGERGRAYKLETAALRLTLELEEVEFGKEGVKPESFFEKVKFRIRVWRK